MGIPKSNLEDFLKENKGYKVLKMCSDTLLIKLPNGEILKVLDDDLLQIIASTGYNLEKRLNVVDSLGEFTNFAWPTRMLEEKGRVKAYVMPYIPGVDFTDYYENVYDLESYAKIHSQIENNIKDGNGVGIVFPDLCTTENIRITPEGKVVFIDYDGLQVKQMPAVGFSDFLGTPDDVLTDKYFDSESYLFSKELDVKSAIYLYFVDVFRIHLAMVNKRNPYTGKVVTLDEVFSLINLDDPDIQHKVWKLFQSSIPNEFLGEDLFHLAEKYKLVQPSSNIPLKNLVKK